MKIYVKETVQEKERKVSPRHLRGELPLVLHCVDPISNKSQHLKPSFFPRSFTLWNVLLFLSLQTGQAMACKSADHSTIPS